MGKRNWAKVANEQFKLLDKAEQADWAELRNRTM